jgi:transcriptional regulator with XRE-family HTH domain
MDTSKPRARFNEARVTADMALRGWNQTDLARSAKLSMQTVSNFLHGIRQTHRSMAAIARALGHPIKRYFTHVEAA